MTAPASLSRRRGRCSTGGRRIPPAASPPLGHAQRGGAGPLKSAVQLAESASPSLEALAAHSEAAAELLAADDHRYKKVAVDLFAGSNLTAAGLGFLPVLGMTGVGVFPIPYIQLRPEELQTLQAQKNGADAKAQAALGGVVQAQLAGQLVTEVSAYRTADEAYRLAQGQLVPERTRAAASGDGEAQHALAEAQTQAEAFKTQRDQAQAQINYLLGHPIDAAIDFGQDPQKMIGELQAIYARQSPLDAHRQVLAQRVATTQAVETIVDKNLKVQELRIEPVSLIGRSLGRLISALSGSGQQVSEGAEICAHGGAEAVRRRCRG